MRPTATLVLMLLAAVAAAEAQCWRIEQDLLPGWPARLWRMTTFESSLIDQPDEILQAQGDPPMAVPIRNPTQDLLAYDVTAQPGKFFWSVEDFSNAYSILVDKDVRALIGVDSAAGATCPPNSKPLNVAKDPLLKRTNKLEYLAWGGGAGFGKRLLNSLSISIGESERSGVIGSTPIPPEFFLQDDDEDTRSITFDPDELFVRPKDLPDAYDALASHIQLHPGIATGLSPIDLSICAALGPVACLRKAVSFRLAGGWVAALLPRIEAKTVDQFDFALVGAAGFVPGIEDSILTVTATWDLSTMDGARNRRDAIKALAAHQKLAERELHLRCRLDAKDPPASRIDDRMPLRLQLTATYLAVAGTCPATRKAPVSWELVPDRGRDPKLIVEVSSTGLFSAIYTDPVDPKHPKSFTVQVKAQDDLAKSDTADVKFEVY